MLPLSTLSSAAHAASADPAAKSMAHATRDAETARNRQGQSFDDVFGTSNAHPDARLSADSNPAESDSENTEAGAPAPGEPATKSSNANSDDFARTLVPDNSAKSERAALSNNKSTIVGVPLSEDGETFQSTSSTNALKISKVVTSIQQSALDEHFTSDELSASSKLRGPLQVAPAQASGNPARLGTNPKTSASAPMTGPVPDATDRVSSEITSDSDTPFSQAGLHQAGRANVNGIARASQRIAVPLETAKQTSKTTAVQKDFGAATLVQSTASDAVASQSPKALQPNIDSKFGAPTTDLDVSKYAARLQAKTNSANGTTIGGAELLQPSFGPLKSVQGTPLLPAAPVERSSAEAPTSAIVASRQVSHDQSSLVHSFQATPDVKSSSPTARFDKSLGENRSDLPRPSQIPGGNTTGVHTATAPVAWSAAATPIGSEADPKEIRLGDLLNTLARTDQSHATSASQNHQTAPQRADLPPHIARQLAEALPRAQNRPVDIILSPEELGRVRMSVSVTETGVTVNLLAERPETLDLLRRNIDLLGQDFQSLGFESIAFAFADENAQSGDETGAQDVELPPADTTTNIDEAPVIELQNGASSGLDLRL